MDRVSVDDVEPATDDRERERRGLTANLGTTDVAINHYRLEPGERISGLHAHGDQEEVFVVVEGTATFETLAPTRGAGPPSEDGELSVGAGEEVSVGAGEAIRFAPGEFQSGKNDSDGAVVVYALGAPPDSEDVRIPLACPECGHDSLRPTLVEGGAAADGAAADGATPVLRCPDCGGESPVECPDCGGADMTARLGDDGETPVSACRDCGYESPTL